MLLRLRAPRRALLALMLLVVVGGCGGGTSLSGSIGDVMSIDYDKVAYYSDGGSLNITYKKGSDLVCKLIVDAINSGAKAGKTITGPDFPKYVTLSRVTAKGDDFPKTLSGEIKFNAFSVASGAAVSGSFNVLFVEGHTIVGTFDGTVANP